ncbi:CenpB-DNA-bind-domain-containing protein [Cylindrobasidium torrendii FP15055 ss-10]|uniref:CenpB-DNA-bind-domain-containing protein n=1 Tax=Cylindrobasidium torrendii FP15055 ss-10 TaxID=1314674 RepID=A0A0D7BA55_9AGAR|nr:CenpB-DNA-bind-domain-containing protein [Cylindrobasidium torrendii FP15055 ss-10]
MLGPVLSPLVSDIFAMEMPSQWHPTFDGMSAHGMGDDYPTPLTSLPPPYPPNGGHPLDSTFEAHIEPSSGPDRPITRGRSRRATQDYRDAYARRSGPRPDQDPSSSTAHLATELPLLPPAPGNMYPPSPDSASARAQSFPASSSTAANAGQPGSPSSAPTSSATMQQRSASPALSAATDASSDSGHLHQKFASFPPAVDSSGKPKHRKQRLFNLDRRAICVYHRDHPSARQEDIALKYGVERSTISKILKYKDRWLNVPADEHVLVAKHRTSKWPDIEYELLDWIHLPETKKTPLTDMRLRDKAKEIARELGVTEERFKASSGWVENFKNRHGIRGGAYIGDGKNSDTRRNRTNSTGAGPARDWSHLGHGGNVTNEHPPPTQPHQYSQAMDMQTHDLSAGPSQPYTTEQEPYHPHPHPDDPNLIPAVYNDGTVIYQRHYDPDPLPSLAEAEVYINKLCRYFSEDREDIAWYTSEDRKALHRIKIMLFQAGSGIPPDPSVI